ELKPHEKAVWESLGLEPKPFNKVRYLLPRGYDGQPNCYPPVPAQYQIYAYDLMGTADKMDLLFSNVADPSGTVEGISGEIMTGLLAREDEFKKVQGWDALLEFLREKQAGGKWRGMFAASSIGMFRRHLRRIVQTRETGIFVNSRARAEKSLSTELTNIKGGTTYVVDIAKLADDEQTLVFGDILRTIYAAKAEAVEERTETGPVPDKVIIFVDELNKYAPGGGNASPITQQVLDVAERGRSLGVILISAQQFMSAVHSRVTGNSATKIIGRTGSSEVNAPDYRFLDQDIRSAVTRLSKGELLISHAIYRQPIKVVFPKPAYRQDQ
ncbi:MAG TPA: ATP-binding protein, partial [Pyrinomonadaceae bacterium]|nr:ATP-binding protein [Pyrinomonadaceae bacterium]